MQAFDLSKKRINSRYSASASSASADLRHEWRYIKCTFTLHYITLHYITLHYIDSRSDI